MADARDNAAEYWQKDLERVIRDAMLSAADTYEAGGKIDLPPDHRQRMEAAMIGIWSQAARDAARAVIGDYKSDFGIETKQDEESFFDRIVSVFAELFGAKKVRSVTDTLREQIANIVLGGQRQGLGLPEIASQIREVAPSISRWRAAIIARTEAHGSSNFAANEAAKTSRRPLMKEWIAVEDHRTRDFGEGDGVVDQFSHRAIDGQKVPMDQPFMVPTIYGTQEPLMFPGDPSGSPGNVINCFLPGTKVRGRFIAGTKSSYVGDIVEIKTASGRNISVTANHPIIANGRLVAAHNVREGDNLIAYSAEIEDSVWIGDANIKNGPSSIDEVFAAIRDLGHSFSSGVIGEDFHGDGQFINGDIDIVVSNRPLIVGCNPALGEFLDNLSLKHTNSMRGHIFSLLNARRNWARFTANGFMCGMSKIFSFISSCFRHALKHGLASVSCMSTSSFYGASNTQALHSEFFGNAFDTSSRIMKFADEDIRWVYGSSIASNVIASQNVLNTGSANSQLGSDAVKSDSRFIERDRVISVIIKPYSGHVYDLQEESGIMLAENIAVSNCRCVVGYSRAD